MQWCNQQKISPLTVPVWNGRTHAPYEMEKPTSFHTRPILENGEGHSRTSTDINEATSEALCRGDCSSDTTECTGGNGVSRGSKRLIVSQVVLQSCRRVYLAPLVEERLMMHWIDLKWTGPPKQLSKKHGIRLRFSLIC